MPTPHPKYPLVLSIAAAVSTFALKGLAYWLTDSVSLLSDAMESLVNLAAAVIALISLYYAARPVDVSHTYGHEKIEYFSSGPGRHPSSWCGRAIACLRPAIGCSPPRLADLARATLLAAVHRYQPGGGPVLLRVARPPSPSCWSDGPHLMTDVYTSAGV